MSKQKIEDVEGIGPVTGEKLRGAGVKDTDAMLTQCKTPAARKALAAATGISEAQILKFANMVDLYRVKGIGSEYAQLLEKAGVDTVPELARRNAANLTTALATANTARDGVGRLPSEAEVGRWIEAAKALPRALEY
jgi:predicted flap endonuclease-1-like 5' DNA nuclease